MACNTWQILCDFFIEYETPRTMNVRSKAVGIVKRLVQLLVIVYIGGYVLWYEKGYQEFSRLESAVTTKVKGIAFSDAQLTPMSNTDTYSRIWDPVDIVIPPQQNGAFFVLTNVIITPNQTIGKCPEIPFGDSMCNETNVEKLCSSGTYHVFGNGMRTGRCVPYNETVNTCEIHSWCPPENDDFVFEHPLLYDTKNFTVLIKNHIVFVEWNAKLNVFISDKNKVIGCRYHRLNSPLCPIFKLEDIVEESGHRYADVAQKGGVIVIGIEWNCNLDLDLSKCVPKYSFHRLDDSKTDISPGWNFRFAHYFSDRQRTLHKAFGILFIIVVSGRAGKFSILPTLLNVGSGLGLLSLVEIICDLILLHLLAKKELYRRKKTLTVHENESDSEVEQREMKLLKTSAETKQC